MGESICKKENCKDCECSPDFLCKFTGKDLTWFILIGLTVLIPSVIYFSINLLITEMIIGLGIFLFVYTIGAPAFLCRHCKYYSLPGKFIKCPGHYGAPKIFKYNSNPLNKLEK